MKNKSELLSTFLGVLKLPSFACKEGYLNDSQLLSRLVDNEDLPSLDLLFAIEELFQSVGIKIRECPSLLDKLPENFSISDVVSLVYQRQHKTIEDIRQFFLSELGLAQVYQENPDIIKCHVLDGIPAKYGQKRLSVTVAIMRLFRFVNVDFSHNQLPCNPTFAEVIDTAYQKQS